MSSPMRIGDAVRVSAMAALFGALLSGCSGGSSGTKPNPSANGEFPGYDPPSLGELVKTAVAKGPPKQKGAAYVRPAKIAVPPLKPQDLSWLPKDGSGKAYLNEVLGARLVYDPKKNDPITGKGKCVALATHCVQPIAVEHGRSIDECWMSSPECQTNQPWLEADCCPSRCLELYESLRKLDYSDLEASDRTVASYCFPSLREYMTRKR